MKLKIKLKEQELESLSDKCHKLEVRVLELEEELSKANEHIQKFATKLKEASHLYMYFIGILKIVKKTLTSKCKFT